MEARFLGHAAVLLMADDGTSLLIDPYNPGGFSGRMAYAPIPYQPDAVVCSHDHLDHCAVGDLANRPQVIDGEGAFGPFSVRRHQAYHDEYAGRRRGGAVDILDISVDGLRLVHLSDVGESPRAELVAALRGPDVLFVPVGGFFTIGAAQAFEWSRRLAPARVVPVHYKTARCALSVRPRANFEAYVESPGQAPGEGEPSCVELKSRMISFDHSAVLLQPEC